MYGASGDVNINGGHSHFVNAPAKCLTAIADVLDASNTDNSGGVNDLSYTTSGEADYDYYNNVSDQTHCFLVGTFGRRIGGGCNGDHFVQLLKYQNSDYSSGGNDLQVVTNFRHDAGEVCAMSASKDGTVATCGGSISKDGKYVAKSKVYTKPSVPVGGDEERSDDDRGLNDDETYSRRRNIVSPSFGDIDNDKGDDATVPVHKLGELVTLKHPTDSELARLLWKPERDVDITPVNSISGELVTLGPDGLSLFDIVGGKGAGEIIPAASSKIGTDNDIESEIVSGAWNPHDLNVVGLAHFRSISLYDIRDMKPTQILRNCNRYPLLDMDFNPNRPNVLTTSGENGLIKFWDLRKSEKPIKIISGHSHWVTKVRYNKFHDQLFLSCGTDSFVNLWRLSSISSAPYMELEGDVVDVSNQSDVLDMCIQRSEHQAESSVYDIAWSVCDAWLYASLSFDGQVNINHVPSKEKYKILL